MAKNPPSCHHRDRCLQIFYTSRSGNDRKSAAEFALFPNLKKFSPAEGFTMTLWLRWSIALGIPLVANRELQVAIPVEDRLSPLRHHYRWE